MPKSTDELLRQADARYIAEKPLSDLLSDIEQKALAIDIYKRYLLAQGVPEPDSKYVKLNTLQAAILNALRSFTYDTVAELEKG